MTCAEAIALVLSDARGPLRAQAIAAEINERGLYRRADGSPLPAYQVSSVAHGQPQRFRIAGGLIDLAGAERQEADAQVDPVEPTPIDAEPICVLIGCVSRKESAARRAKDLYRTELFSRRRAYAEASGRPWLIVSALHGILDPEDVIEPYDVRITDLERPVRDQLADGIVADLDDRFGPLNGALFEVHAGEEYVRVLTQGLRPRGARLVNPLRGLRIGEQLAWYAQRLSPTVPASPAPPITAGRPTRPGLARDITTAFQAGELDLSARADAPAAGWDGMPEVIVARRLRAAGAHDADVRLVLTLAAAMDRARDADALWSAAERLYNEHPWAFVPEDVVRRSFTDLADVLRQFGVSQRHGPDAAAWRVIAESLADAGLAPAIRAAVFNGHGDARELLVGLQDQSVVGTDRFPFLRGPKVGPMWVRMLAYPGAATIENIAVLPVAVDVQVRKVTEYLEVTDTGPLDLDAARPIIQAAWAADVEEHGAVGPAALGESAAALDPALWFWAKWGCTRCERAKRRIPVSHVCEGCRFPARS